MFHREGYTIILTSLFLGIVLSVLAYFFIENELLVRGVNLLILILMIQFFAFFGALLFGRVAQRIGAKRGIMISLVVWSGIVIYAFALLQEE